MTRPSFPGWSEEPSDGGAPRPPRIPDPLLAGLAIGFLWTLLGADRAWGINVAICAVALAAVGAIGVRRARPGDRRDRLAGFALAALFSLGFAVTENETIRALDAFAVCFSFSLPLLRPACLRLAAVRPLPLALAVFESALLAWFGTLTLLPDRLGSSTRRGGSAARGPLLPVLAGSAAALVLVLLFGSLLRASDARFDGWVERQVDAEWLAGRVASLGAIAWLATGWLHGAFARPLGERTPFPAADPCQLRAPTVLIPLVSLLLLFGGFVGLQATYLFPAERPAAEDLAGLARRGFFELVAVGGLALPLLLAADSCLRYARRPVRIAFVAGAALLLALIGAILASAAARLGLYVERFGWTESRYFAAVFLGWTALALAGFAATALRGAPERFLPGALAAAFAVGVGLHAVSPESVVVASLLDREKAPAGAVEREIDWVHLRSLGLGAVPAFAARWERIPVEERYNLRVGWGLRTGEERPAAAWNLARARAERTMARLPPVALEK